MFLSFAGFAFIFFWFGSRNMFIYIYLYLFKFISEASRKRVNKEGEANTLDVNPKVFALHSEEDIIEQFLLNKS